MEGIEKELMELYFQSDNCIRCGRCTTVCPTFAVAKKETMVARGRVRLAREYIEGNLDLSSRLKLYYDLCLGCNACLEVCPPRIKTADLVSYVKFNIIKKKGLSFTDSAFLKGLLNKPNNMRTLMVLLSISRKTGINNLLPDSLKAKEKVLPDIPERSFREQYSYVTEKVKNKKYRVGYFVGCLTDNFYPGIAYDVIKVLKYHDCEVIIPPGTVCCGLPHRVSGDWEECRKLAGKNIELFLNEKVDYILTDCGTCGHALKDYAQYFLDSKEHAADAKKFSERVYDVSEFLVDVVGLKVGSNSLTKDIVTYHGSCHLNRNQKISRQPREILKAIPGLNYVEMREADWCCGAAGSFSFKHRSIANKILERKVSNIKKTGAHYVAAECPACLIQLDFGRKEFGLEYKVRHTIQLLAQTLES